MGSSYGAIAAKKKRDADKKKKETTAPKLGTVLEMPSIDSASVAAAGDEFLRNQAKRRGRSSTLLSDPTEQPLAARDVLTESVLAREEAARIKAEEAKKKKLVALGLYTPTVLGGGYVNGR